VTRAGRGLLGRLIDGLTWLTLAIGGVALVARPGWAPLAVLPGLALAVGPLVRAWRGAGGTALRAPVVWGFIAVALGVVTEALALSEPLATGRPAAGHAAYLCTLAALAGLVSVLNARTPGGGAWAVLMALLVLVFLIPWLEGPGLGRAGSGLGRLRLDSPWNLFYALLVLAGVTNYLPTRYGPAAAWLALGFGLEYLALTQPGRPAGARASLWGAVPWTLAAAAATADLRARRVADSPERLERVWYWFRDHWGVVWALRVQERFNRTAQAQRWPFKLGWHGVEPAGPPPPTGAGAGPAAPPAAAATLTGLLRRFAEPWRIDRAASPGGGAPCQPPMTG